MQQYGVDIAQLGRVTGKSASTLIEEAAAGGVSNAQIGNLATTGDAATKKFFQMYQQKSPNGAFANDYNGWLADQNPNTLNAMRAGIYTGQAIAPKDYDFGGIYGPPASARSTSSQGGGMASSQAGYSANNTTTTTSANPYASSLSTRDQGKLDTWVATKISARESTMTAANYATFINTLVTKITTLKSRMTEEKKIAVLNYLLYEVSAIQSKLSDSTGFIDSLLN